MKVLITGVTGFIGGHLVPTLVRQGYDVTGAVRAESTRRPELRQPGLKLVEIADIAEERRWSRHLRGIDVVIHLAGRVHVMRETSHDPLARFREVNVQGTLRLAESAMAAGVRRFVYLSSIKVNGEATDEVPFNAEDAPRPQGAYAQSKYEAEQALLSLATRGDMDVVIIRPPLVYGAGAGGNFARLVRLVKLGLPLPFRSVRNRRSLLAVGNLVDFIETCITHPAASNQVFLVSDGQSPSTAELIEGIARHLGRRARLFALPPTGWRVLRRIPGLRGTVARLCDSLVVDITKAQRVLGWRPPETLDQALAHALHARRSGYGQGVDVG